MNETYTHNVQLWLINDYNYYRHIVEVIQEICSWTELDEDDPQTSINEAVEELEHHLMNYWTDLLDEEACDLSPIFKEILYREWDAINWAEIAEYYSAEIGDTFAEMMRKSEHIKS